MVLISCIIWKLLVFKLFTVTFVVLPASAELSKTITKVPKGEDICKQMRALFLRKDSVEQTLKAAMNSAQSNDRLSPKAREHQSKAIAIFQREINDTLDTLFKSIISLRRILSGDFRSIYQLKEASRARLELLKQAMVTAEDEYNDIIDEEKSEVADEQKQITRADSNVLRKFINDLMTDLASAATDLELKLNDDLFEKELHDNRKMVNIETVIRIGDEENLGNDDGSDGIIMLVDSLSNHFVLSKPTDSTITHVDHVLLWEIMVVVTLSLLFGLVGVVLRIPTVFAFIVVGIVLGPSGAGFLKSIVQLETIGELGVFFMLFQVGLEFSPSKFKLIWWPSVVGDSAIVLLHALTGLFWGGLLGIRSEQSIFVALCLTFSSTSMVSRLLSGLNGKDHLEAGEDFSSLLLAMLVLQDVLLGVFMAVLPILAGHRDKREHSFAIVPRHDWFHGSISDGREELFWTIVELACAISGVAFLAFGMAKYLSSRVFRFFSAYVSRDFFVLGIVSSVFLLAMLTGSIGVSLELGTFIAGVIIGSAGEKAAKQVNSVVDPLKDLFSCFFFASIGFHVFPTFVLSEIAFFVPVTFLVLLTKLLVSAAVLHQLLPSGDKSKWIVSVGLSQLSEFSFVLGSRARRFGLISREIYLSILSVTTLSMLVAPVMWGCVLSLVMSPRQWNVRSMLSWCKLF